MPSALFRMKNSGHVHMTASGKRVLLAMLGAGSIFAANAADEFQVQPEVRPPATMTVLNHAESVLGRKLVGASGENAGRIVDVLTDETGQVRAVIVEFGGFLGVGSRRIAVAWSDLRFGPDVNPHVVAVDLARERLSRAPEVKAGQPVVVISAGRPAWNRTEARK